MQSLEGAENLCCQSNHWHDVCGPLSCKGTFSTDCEDHWWHFAFVKQQRPANTSAHILAYECHQFLQLGTAEIWLGTRAVITKDVPVPSL